jgi:integrase/recombinase XerD
MQPLRHALEDSLALRRAMGCKLSEASPLLPRFVECLAQRGHTFITTAEAVEWATQPQHVQPAEWARRLRWVRGVARYQHAIDPRTAIPPPALLPYRPQRRAPSLYREAEIAKLLAAASRLPSARALRAATYTTGFG